MISQADKNFLTRKAMSFFGIPKLGIESSDSTEKWPDIWVEFGGEFPVITVTREWAKQSVDERRKRLVHECLHVVGFHHPEGGSRKVLRYVYSTYPKEDTFSRFIYNKIKGGK